MSADIANKYVVGFAFIEYYGQHVVLMEKKRPDWQAGCLNGVGGHMRTSESPQGSMSREFAEETGAITLPTDWQLTETIEFDNGVTLHVLACDYRWPTFPRTVTDEVVGIYTFDEVARVPVHPMLQIQDKINHARKVLDGKASYRVARPEYTI